MNPTSLIVCVIASLAGAWGIMEIARTAETDWFGLPKLMVAVVMFGVFFAIGAFIFRSIGSNRTPRQGERDNHIDSNDDNKG